ncbi:MAG: ABC transporter ATP-binding protein/permease [Caldisericaceae bacterium]
MSEKKSDQQKMGPMLMGGGQSGLRSAVEKPRDFWGSTKRFIRYLKPQLGRIIFVLLLAMVSTVFAVFGPRISGNAINEITNGFIAKNLVTNISEAQTKAIPQINKLLTELKNTQLSYENKAELEVRKQFEGKNVPENLVNEAIQKAKENAKIEVLKQFLRKAKLTEEQFNALTTFVSYPIVNTISNYNKRAEVVQEIINLSSSLPLTEFSKLMGNSTSTMKNLNFSQTGLTRALEIIRKNGGKIPFDSIGKILLLLVLLYFLSAFLTFIVQYIMSDVSQKITYSMRKELFNKLMNLPMRFYDTHSTGDILSRMSNDLDTVSNTLQQSITQVIISITQLVGFLVMMFTISGKLTIISILSLPIYTILMSLIIKYSQKFFADQQKHLGRLLGHAEEMYTGHVIVKTYNREKDSINKFENINNDLYSANWKAQFLTGIMMPATNFISNVAYVFIAVFGGIFVTHNVLNLGDITAFIQYSRSFSQPIVQIANISNIFQSTIACVERVFNVLDEKEEESDSKDAIILNKPQGGIAFNNVYFNYTKEKPLYEGLSIKVNKGETIAIVGPTGAGKTTLVNLLMRFYEIQGGEITFDGVDIRHIKRGSLRRNIGMVLQDTWLFNGTIKENIAYGKENATFEEIVNAAKLAYADRFIRSLPDGYDTVINEESSNISSGEKQLITIARAFLIDPTVLILDEATSNVDTRTEKLIQKAMEKLMKGRTSFVIAHRLSTIRDAKNILVMDNGKVIEQGSHEELLKKNGFYAELYYAQFLGAFDSDNIPNPKELKSETAN